MKNQSIILLAAAGVIIICSWAKSDITAFAQPQTPNPPAIVSTVAPVLPLLVARAGVSNNVFIELEINSAGTVQAARVIEGHPLLMKATLDACSQWRFSPAKLPLRTVRLTFIYPHPSSEGVIRIVVLPYKIELKADFVQYPILNFQEGKDRCKIHRLSLKKEKVAIVFGLVGFKEGYLKAEKKLFPHSNKIFFGGCVVTGDKYAEVLYCRKCREAEAGWHKAHRKENRYSTTGA